MAKVSKNIQELAETFFRTTDEKDFNNLYERIKPGLLNHCRTILIENEVAEDAVSNTMAKIWTKKHQYDPLRGHFSTWIYNIARNESLLIKKKKQRFLPMLSESLDLEDDENGTRFSKIEASNFFDPDWSLEKEENRFDSLYDQVVERMKDLPEIYKEILIDREIEKMKYQDIAEKHGMKKRAVATRIRRARIKIRQMFPEAKLSFFD